MFPFYIKFKESVLKGTQITTKLAEERSGQEPHASRNKHHGTKYHDHSLLGT